MAPLKDREIHLNVELAASEVRRWIHPTHYHVEHPEGSSDIYILTLMTRRSNVSLDTATVFLRKNSVRRLTETMLRFLDRLPPAVASGAECKHQPGEMSRLDSNRVFAADWMFAADGAFSELLFCSFSMVYAIGWGNEQFKEGVAGKNRALYPILAARCTPNLLRFLLEDLFVESES